MFKQIKRSGAAMSQAHKLGDLIEEAQEAQEAYEKGDDHLPEADKVSLEMDRMLDRLKKLSPKRLQQDAQELLKTIRHVHTSLNRYYLIDEQRRHSGADAFAAAADRLTVLIAGLNPDETSVREFDLT